MFTGAAVVMGVSSSGKTLIGEGVARRLGVPFIEGDSLHAPESIAKMSAGIPLTDDDRWPWLERIGKALAGPGGQIAACSALKRSYRDAIARAAGRPLAFVLLRGDRPLLEQRIRNRSGHFMPPSLLDSQLATLEEPGPDETSIILDIADTPEQLIDQTCKFLLGLPV